MNLKLRIVNVGKIKTQFDKCYQDILFTGITALNKNSKRQVATKKN